jgi:hypothetical protein
MLRTIRTEKWTLKLAAFSFVSLVVVLAINHFREELFGIVPGYAPHNFSFNVSFFIPATLVILITSLISIVGTLYNWNKWRSLKYRMVPLVLTMPIVGLFLFRIWWVMKN